MSEQKAAPTCDNGAAHTQKPDNDRKPHKPAHIKAPWLLDDARIRQLWGTSACPPRTPDIGPGVPGLLAYVASAPLRRSRSKLCPPTREPCSVSAVPMDTTRARLGATERETLLTDRIQPTNTEDGGARVNATDSALVVDWVLRERRFDELRGQDGTTLREWLQSTGHVSSVHIDSDNALRPLLARWLTTKVDDAQYALLLHKVSNASLPQKRPRASSPPSPQKSARITARYRYSLQELLALRHTRRLESLNAYAISKAAAETTRQIAHSADFTPDAHGRLRTSDVLLSLTSGLAPPSFADMRLPNAVVCGLLASGFEKPSPVQYRGIPIARLGADLIAQAKSGTGKTVVFAAVAAEIAESAAPGRVVAVVLVPTRELARQVAAVVSGVKDAVAVLVGGKPEWRDVALLNMANIVVGTPARICACIASSVLDVTGVKLLVLDEADQLLDKDADVGLAAVVARLPARRQTCAFSATYTPALVARLRALMREPQLVWLGDGGGDGGGGGDQGGDALAVWRAAVLRGVQQYRLDAAGDKTAALVRVLSARAFKACVAFTRTRERARMYARALRRAGFTARHVSAALPDAQRREAVCEFAKGKVQVLVGTDLLARGVSFEMCDLVVQIDVADEVGTYLHRVGRAGRFGGKGIAVALVDKQARCAIAAVEAHIGRILAWPFGSDRTAMVACGTGCGDATAAEPAEAAEAADGSDGDAAANDGEHTAGAAARIGGGSAATDAAGCDISAAEDVVGDIEERGAAACAVDTDADAGGDAASAARLAGALRGYAAAMRVISRIEAYRESRVL